MHIVVSDGENYISSKNAVIKANTENLIDDIINTTHTILVYDINLSETIMDWVNHIDKLGYQDVTEKEEDKQPGQYEYVINSIGIPYKIDILITPKARILVYNGDLLLPDITDLKEFKRGVKLLHKNGWDGITLSSCAMKAFKSMINKYDFSSYFQNSHKRDLYEGCSETVEDFIRRGYRGGWCYLKESQKDLYRFEKGVTLDINSLYPYIMRTVALPYGKFTYFEDEVPAKIRKGSKKGWYFYYQEIMCKYKLKDGYLPVIQLEDDFMTEEGNGRLVLTGQELELFLEHYEVSELQYIQGVYYNATHFLFAKYIDRFYPLKKQAKGSERKIYKGFMNYLSGNMAKKTMRYNMALKPSPHLYQVEVKTQSYIQVGAAITSLARCKIIQDAQAHYDQLIYTDTDSLHLLGDIPDNLQISDTELGAYKVERVWYESIFWGKKTYAEQSADKLKLVLAGVPNDVKEELEEEYNHSLIKMVKPQTGEDESLN